MKYLFKKRPNPHEFWSSEWHSHEYWEAERIARNKKRVPKIVVSFLLAMLIVWGISAIIPHYETKSCSVEATVKEIDAYEDHLTITVTIPEEEHLFLVRTQGSEVNVGDNITLEKIVKINEETRKVSSEYYYFNSRVASKTARPYDEYEKPQEEASDVEDNPWLVFFEGLTMTGVIACIVLFIILL